MELDSRLLRQFAEVANGNRETGEAENTAYGTVVKNGEVTYVRLDGTELLTPVSMAMDAEDGDRVVVTIKNHTATITGNVSSPASARTATKFMKFTDEGLAVGDIGENGKANGPHTLMCSDTYYIVDKDGNKIASFSGTMVNLGNGMAVMTVDEINLGNGKAVFTTDHAEVAGGAAYFSPSLLKLGNKDSSEVQLCNGKGKIKMDGDILLISGSTAVGLRTIYGGWHFADVVCRTDRGGSIAAIQAYRGNGTGSSVIADLNGVRVNTPTGTMSVNGQEVLLSNTLMVVGTVTATGSIKKGKRASLTAKVPVPSGYNLAGIREIKTNHNSACRMTQFYTHPSVNQVGATFVNTSSTDFTNKDMSKSDKKLQVTIEWFAFRCSAATVSGDNIIDWVED